MSLFDQLPKLYVESTRAAEGFSRRVFTVDDMRRMIDAGVIGEDERVELIDGEITALSPKPIAHEMIKAALGTAMLRRAPDHVIVAIATTLQLTTRTLVDPDVAVFSRNAFRPSAAGFAKLDPGEAHLIVEIAAANLAYDQELKARLYALHNVREFWLIDANERTTLIHTCASGERWTSIVSRGADDLLATDAVPGFSIRLADIG